MVLVDMAIGRDEEGNSQTLKFMFDIGTILEFECPIGMSATVAMDMFKQFIAISEDLIIHEGTIH